MLVTSGKLTKQLNKIAELKDSTLVRDIRIGDTRHIVIKVSNVMFAIDQECSDTFNIAMCWPNDHGGYEYGYNSKNGKTVKTAKNFIGARV